MEIDDVIYFCNCLLSNHVEHPVAVDGNDQCVYCNHYAIKRAVTKGDIRKYNANKEFLDDIKNKYLEMIIKDKRYKEKVN